MEKLGTERKLKTALIHNHTKLFDKIGHNTVLVYILNLKIII